MEAPSLRGTKVRIDRFTAVDIGDDYIGWLNDPAVTRFSNQRFRAHDRASCEAYVASFEGSANLFLAVRRLDDSKLIGTMTAYRSVPHGTVDVGIMIGDPETWGGGFGQDAWNLVIDWLASQPDIRKVTAGTLACNRGMVRLMERSGMIFDGARRAQEMVEGEPQDVVYYARFADR
ncbi:GNAT family N-acetyltransferase [Sphingomonas sp. LT1P40]|uniref:GNAT family N-acetyltransferase n=1 Tax=Alteristakelama amylovorans TaxID=3096166 RepID=UPI002FC5F430